MHETYGRYEILSEVGKGGMATVFLANDPYFDRQVVIKILPRELMIAEDFRLRFEREAKIIAALENPAIVPVYDFGEDHGLPYIVMRYMSEGSLVNQLDHSRRMPFAAVVQMTQRMAMALDEAHGSGVIHRDLKPANILYDKRKLAYLSDFGVAKLSEATVQLTKSGIVGTPAYMSPEQAMGLPDIDGRSDVYTLGLIIFEVLTGQAPFQADTPVKLMMMHVQDAPPNICNVEPKLPDGMEEVIYKTLAKRQEDRYASIGELAEELTRVFQLTTGKQAKVRDISDETTSVLGVSGLQACLRHSDGTELHLDKDSITIGRDETRDIDLSKWDDKRYVSHFHAEIFYEAGEWRLRPHIKSRNPTKVNNRRIKPGEAAILKNGDRLQFAHVIFSFGVIE
jgi:serine/threonine-protein kinase